LSLSFCIAIKYRQTRYNELNKDCGKRKRNLENRRCFRRCNTDSDCRGSKRKCLCDGECGMSCIRLSKLSKFLLTLCRFWTWFMCYLKAHPVHRLENSLMDMWPTIRITCLEAIWRIHVILGTLLSALMWGIAKVTDGGQEIARFVSKKVFFYSLISFAEVFFEDWN